MSLLYFFLTDPYVLLLILIFSFSLVYIPLSIIFSIIFAIVDIHKKKFHFLKKFLVIDGAVLLVFVFLTGLNIYMSRPPSADKLTQNYLEHKKEFLILNEKILTDQKKGLERVDNTWTEPGDIGSIELSEANIEEYREKLNKLNVPRGFYSYPDQVKYIAYAYGVSVSGSSRGYLYSKNQPKNFFKESCGYSERPLNDLEEYKKCKGSTMSHVIYQQIDKNWYIFEDYED